MVLFILLILVLWMAYYYSHDRSAPELSTIHTLNVHRNCTVHGQLVASTLSTPSGQPLVLTDATLATQGVVGPLSLFALESKETTYTIIRPGSYTFTATSPTIVTLGPVATMPGGLISISNGTGVPLRIITSGTDTLNHTDTTISINKVAWMIAQASNDWALAVAI